jgi:hypothetical protein
MSVSLTYQGKLKTPELIEPIITELRDLAKEHGWKHESSGPKEFTLVYGPVATARGIHITLDPKAGMFAKFSLAFAQDGHTINETMLALYSDEQMLRKMNETINPLTGQPQYHIQIPETEEEKKRVKWADIVKSKIFPIHSIDTDNLGAETHILLCKLLRYLGKKYFRRLLVYDSSGYWKTGNVGKLIEEIRTMNFFYGHVGKFFNHATAISLPPNATLKDLLADLTTYLALVYDKAPHKPSPKS